MLLQFKNRGDIENSTIEVLSRVDVKKG